MYRTTYNGAINQLGDIDDWVNQSGIKLLHPIKLRDIGRPCMKRKKSWMEKKKQTKTYKCSTCGGSDHKETSFVGGTVGYYPKKKRVITKCNFDGDSFVQRTATPKKMRKKATKTTSSSSKYTVASSKKKTTSAPTTSFFSCCRC